MFRKLKEKISEEVKQSPLLQPFREDGSGVSSKADGGGCSGDDGQTTTQNLIDFRVADSVIDLSDARQTFSIGDNDDETPATSPVGNLPASFENVDLSDNVDGSKSRRRRMSSSSTTGSFFPVYSPAPFGYNYQSDLESNASETEDSSGVNLDVVSKEQIFEAFQKLRSRYLRLKGRRGDLVQAYKHQLNENEKLKSILAESQDRALRRISELKEQSQLELKAKAHLEENFQLSLDEKDELINVLQTQVQLLKGSRKAETVAVDVDDDQVPQDDVDTKLHRQEETIAKLKNLLKGCKMTIDQDKETLATLKLENDTLTAKLHEAATRIEALQSEVADKEATFSEELKRAAEKVDQLKQLEEENTVNVAEAKQRVHEEMVAHEKAIDDLKLQLHQLRNEKLQSETQLEDKIKELTEFEQRETELKQLLQEVTEDRRNVLDEVSREKATCEQQLTELKQRLQEVTEDKCKIVDEVSREKTTSEQQLTELKQRLQEVTEDRRNVLDELSRERATSEQLSLTVEEKIKGLTGFEQRETELKQRLQEVTEDKFKILDEVSRERATSEQRLNEEVSKRVEELKQLSATTKGLDIAGNFRSTVALLKTLEANLRNDVAAQVASMSHEFRQVEVGLERFGDLRRDYDERLKFLESEVATKEFERLEGLTRLETVDDERQRLKQQVDELSSTLEAVMATKESDVAEANRRLEVEQMKVAELTTMLSVTKSDHRLQLTAFAGELSNVKRLRKSLDEVRAELLGCKGDFAENVSKLKVEVKQLTDVCRQQSNQVAQLQSEKEETTLNYENRLKTLGDEVESRLESGNREFVAREQSFLELFARLLQQHQLESNVECTNIDGAVDRLTTRLQRLEQHLTALKSTLAELPAKKQLVETLSIEKATLELELNEARQRVESLLALQDEIAELKRLKDGDEQKATELGEQLVATTTRSAQLEATLDELRRIDENRGSQLVEVERQNEELEAKVAEMTTTMAADRERLESEVARLSEVDGENGRKLNEFRRKAEHKFAQIKKQLQTKIDASEARVSELEDRLRVNEAQLQTQADEHVAKIKQLSNEFGDSLIAKDEENRRDVADAAERALTESGRLQLELSERSRELSEHFGALLAEKDEQLKVLQTEHARQLANLDESRRSSSPATLTLTMSGGGGDASNNNEFRSRRRATNLAADDEYLKNILYEYMMGRETLTLAKVIAAVMRFSEEQTTRILEREAERRV